MVEALLATTPPLILAQLIVNEPYVVLTNWPVQQNLASGHFPAIIARLEQSSSSRCSKVTYRGSRIGRDLFSPCIVDVWFPIRPASWRPWRESFVCIRRVFGHRSWLASGGAASRPILRVIALIGRYVVAPPLLSYPPVKIIPTLHRLEV